MTDGVDGIPGEQWRPVVGYEGRYEVSDRGRVRTCGFWVARKNGTRAWWGPRHLKGMRGKFSPHHLTYSLSPGGGARKVWRRAHHLVLESFVGPKPFPEAQGLHHDDDVLNNTPGNLRWGTAQDNADDRIRNGKNPHHKTTHCLLGHSLVLPNIVPTRARVGWRQCQACALTRINRNYDPHRKSATRQWRLPCGFWRDMDETFEQEADRRYAFIMRSAA